MRKISVLVLIIAMMCICMLSGCGEAIDTNDSPQDATNQEVISDDDSVMNELAKIKELEGKNIILVDVYNEIATLAIENGWDADELTVTELDTVNETLKYFNEIITDPVSAHGTDFDELLRAADELTAELDTNMRERVSVAWCANE